MSDQPFVDLGVALDLVLHLFQRCQARLEPGLFPLLRVEFFLGRPARVFQARQLRQLGGKLRILARQLFGQFGDLALLIFNRGGIRSGQTLVFGKQALMPQSQALQRPVRMVDMRLLDLQRLLGLSQGSAFLDEHGLCSAKSLIRLG